MAKVQIFHNISRDASFGLNTVFETGTEAPEGVTATKLPDGRVMWKRQGQGDERHGLVWVFQYEVERTESMTDWVILGEAFETFNIGEGGLARDYRARKLRSLSVGDVVVIDNQAWSCESAGWAARGGRELRTLASDQAEKVIRERFQFRPFEELSITVPLSD